MVEQSDRPSAIFHRSLAKTYPAASGGRGVYIYSPDGKKVLDGSSGAAVSCLGHGHPVVIQAIVDQAQRMAFAHTSFFTSNPAEELAKFLIEQSNGAFERVMFLSSGSEAVESAFKIARQYHLSRGDKSRVNFISRQYSYHGNTLGALSAGFNPPRRKPFEPLLSSVFHHVSRCFFSRDAKAQESESTYVDRLIAEYDQAFMRLGAHTIAAVIVEPVGGATLGAVPAAHEYLDRLKELCERHGALLIFDEVMCGMGRVGTLHAWQSLSKLGPDIQTIGKGLGAGYQPISGILVGKKVYDAIQTGQFTNPFISGHTYQGHSIGCAAALATQKTIVAEKLLDNVRRQGQLLCQRLQESTPRLKEVRGLGLFIAVEFKSEPGSPIAGKVAEACLANGAAVYLCSSAVDAILFAPPFIINESEVEEMVKIFLLSVNQVIEEGK